MLLAVDIGNTNIVFALCDENSTQAQWRISTEAQRTSDEYAVWLFSLMSAQGFSPADVTGAILSSVVPDANFAVKTFIRSYLRTDPLLVASGAVELGMKVLIDQPRELGADRLLNAYAAWESWKQPLIVIDFGTATTFDVVSAKGDYMGGVIAPGINLSLAALQKAAARLTGISIAHPAKVVGSNTVEAMQSGIYHGYAGLIEGIVKRIEEERGEKMKVIATGGLAPLYADATTCIHHVDADLTIRGLRLAYARMKRS